MVLSARTILHLENDRLKFDERIMLYLKTGENKELLKEISQIDCRRIADSSGKTLLHYAIQYRNVEIAEYLIDAGLDVNHSCNIGNSPLLLTLLLGSQQIGFVAPLIRKLCCTKSALRETAHVLSVNQFGTSPLSLAADQRLFRNDVVVLPILQRLVSACDDDEELIGEELSRVKCSLRRAVYLQNATLIQILIDKKIAVNEQDPFQKKTALHDAVQLMDEAIVSVLKKAEADTSIRDIYNKMPCAYYKSQIVGLKSQLSFAPELLKFLLCRKTDLTSLDSEGRFQIYPILTRGTKADIRILLKNKINFFAIDKYQQTIMHLLSYNIENVSEFFMRKEFPVNIYDNCGYTPLFLSVINGNVELVELFLNREANPTIKPQKSNPILFRALSVIHKIFDTLSAVQAQRRIKIIELLLQYGVNVQSRNGLGQTVFHFLSDETMPSYIKPLIAHFAIDCSQEEFNSESIMKKITNNLDMKIYYDHCTQNIDQFKNSNIFNVITKWDILVRNRLELNSIFEKHPRVIVKLRSMLKQEEDSYYHSVIKKKIQKYVSLLEF